MKLSQVSRYQARSAAQAIGIIGALPMRAISTVPDLNSNFGPSGPSDVVTIDAPSFIFFCASRSTRAPVLAAEPRMTSAPHLAAIRAGTSPSTDADTM